MRSFSLRSTTLFAVVAILAMAFATSASATDITPPKGPIAEAGSEPAPGAQRMTFTVGPLQVTPGQNRIDNVGIRDQKPSVDGYITRFKPNLVYADGSVPSTDLVMFHHGVWINISRKDPTAGIPAERLFATGEEKTITAFPNGYGYRYKASDRWILNNMIHNLTADPMELYITYEIDFIPDTAPEASKMTPVRPIWMDVENGSGYPVFDVNRHSGGKDGEFTYPGDAENPYPSGVKENLWTVDRDGVLITTAGHVHTGGLRTDLYLRREGATYEGPDCGAKATKRQRDRCKRRAPAVRGKRAHLFSSEAKYWEPAGPVSWDVAMTGTKPNWRVNVKKGDTLEVTTTYETKLGAWYESMGIMVVYMADGNWGKNPYKQKVDWPGEVTHGHLKENSVHGGKPSKMPDARKMSDGATQTPGDMFTISDFTYEEGDLRFGTAAKPPVVKRGQSLTFAMGSDDLAKQQWHSLTSCKSPCNGSTGIAYPIANGPYEFDSGQLGTITPAVGRTTWSTPPDLPAGTYNYFCRIHPLMRGAFRVKK